MRRQPGLPFALLAALACGTPGDGPQNSNQLKVERDSVGDTLIVRTVSGSTWGSPGRLVSRVAIGSAEGDENLMLGNIQGMAVAADGSIYITEGTPALKKFSPDGAFIRVFGRQGSGPGEYRNPDGGLAVLRDGRVVVRDPSNGRLSLYTPDGAPAGAWRISGGFSTSRRLYSDTAGNIYTTILYDPDVQVTDWVEGLLRFGPDGTRLDSLRAPSWKFERGVIKGQREGSSSVNSVPFFASASWAWSPLGYYVGGLSTSYRIDLFRPGSPLRIERTAPPVPVQPDEAADKKQVAAFNMARQFPGWVWNGPDIPRVKPPFRDIFAGDDGRIWVLLSRAGVKDSAAEGIMRVGEQQFRVSTWKEPSAFDVFEPDGRYLGMVEAPEGFQSWPEPIFRGDTVWAVLEDADGVRYVHRLEINH